MTVEALPPKKPRLKVVDAFLCRHRALVVHFSGTPKGAGSTFEEPYPDDLLTVIKGGASTGVSASLVMPGDEFNDVHRANATGCVGVVLRLRDPTSLVAVHPRDCGSMMSDGVRTVDRETDIELADLERSLTERGAVADHFYNEWVVRDFEVLGLFAAAPYRISLWNPPLPGQDELPDYLRPNLGWVSCNISSSAVIATFAEWPVWSFQAGQIVRVDEGQAVEAPINGFYPR